MALFAIATPVDIIDSMIVSVTTRAAEAVPVAVRESFGSALRALYLYGSLAEGNYLPQQSDINLVAVVEDGVTVHEVRSALRPLWYRQGQEFKIALIVANLSTLQRHLRLEPSLALSISRGGTLVAGADLLPSPQPVSDVEILAKVAYEAMLASAALAPALLPEQEAEECLSRLRRLASRLAPEIGGNNDSPAEWMAIVQSYLSERMKQLDTVRYYESTAARKKLLVDDLLAIYETENRIVLVLPDMLPERINKTILSTDWLEVGVRVEGKYQKLLVTTAGQLRLILEYETAADYPLKNYVHAWGANPIKRLAVADWRVLRHLARLPSELQTVTLPQEYISADEAALSMLVHDFQNKLLNIQLRSELYGKIGGRQTRTPTLAKSDRDAPVHRRIDDICEQLGWWSDYHTAEMEHLLANTR